MPTIRVFNPHRRKRRIASKRRNPGASELFIVGNPKPMARTRKRIRRRHNRHISRRRNPVFASSSRHHRRHHRIRRRSNPLNLHRDASLALWASVGGVATRVGVQAVLPSYNSGVTGYLANAAAALALGWVADKTISENAGQGIVIGGIAATIMRIASDTILKSNPQAANAAAMSGLAGDREFALGDFQSSYFFEPSVNTGPNQVVVPPPFTQYLPPPAPVQTGKHGLQGYDPSFGSVPDRYTSRWS